MLFAIDAGNTNITLGVYNADDLILTARLATDTTMTEDQLAISFKSIFQMYGLSKADFRGAVISSVVPELTTALRKAVEMVTGTAPFLVGPGLKTGINIKVDDPAGLGSDLVAGAIAAKAYYTLPALVVDLGTATKISVIDQNGAFLGCSISPGVRLSLDALAKGASQLSQISLDVPRRAIGTNTVDSMRSGLVYGTADMLDGLIDRMNAELPTPAKTILATGGLSDICNYCKHDMVVDKSLLLKGLKALYDLNADK